MNRYFISQGYKFKKSEKSFVRFTNIGFEKIQIQFYTSAKLVSVSIAWSKSLLVIEKLFSKWEGVSKNYEKQTTMYIDLLNYTRWNSNTTHTWQLFDNTTFKCDDFNLNKAAQGIITAYETYVIPFFKHYSTYENLEKTLNALPIKPMQFAMGYLGYGKHIAIGLSLAYFFKKQNFNSIVEEYKIFALIKEDKVKLDILTAINKTLNFIDTNDITEFLSE